MFHLSNCETLVHLLKGSLGTGILAMPQAFFYAGYVSGILNTVIITAISTYCLLMLVSIRSEMTKNGWMTCKVFVEFKLKNHSNIGKKSVHPMQATPSANAILSYIDENGFGRRTLILAGFIAHRNVKLSMYTFNSIGNHIIFAP